MTDKSIIKNYLNWIKDNTVETVMPNGCIEIATPFLDRHNDGLIIYVKEERGVYTLSDDGYIISDMDMYGASISRRLNNLRNFLKGYGVTINTDNELEITANKQNLPVKQHLLLQAMMAASDMFVPSATSNSENLFIDDIINFFDANNIIYTQNAQFQGKSGLIHKVDFVIPKFKKQPERFVFAMNTPRISSAKSLLFNWEDIQQNRSTECTMYPIINDLKSISNDIINAFKAYSTIPIPWSTRDNYISALSIAG